MPITGTIFFAAENPIGLTSGDYDGDGFVDLAFTDTLANGDRRVTVVSGIADFVTVSSFDLRTLLSSRTVFFTGPEEIGATDFVSHDAAAFLTIDGTNGAFDRLLVGAPQDGAETGDNFADGRVSVLSFGSTSEGFSLTSVTPTISDNVPGDDAIPNGTDPAGFGAAAAYLGDWFGTGQDIAFVSAPDPFDRDAFGGGFVGGFGAFIDVDTGEVLGTLDAAAGFDTTDEAQFGLSVAGAPDDNLLVVGAPGASSLSRVDQGEVLFFKPGETQETARLAGLGDDLLGADVAFVGDIAFEGGNALAIYANDINVPSVGDGQTGGIALLYEPQNYEGSFGVSESGLAIDDYPIQAFIAGFTDSEGPEVDIVSLGDVTGDGIADFAIAAPNQDQPNGLATGVVYVIAGQPDRIEGVFDVREIGQPGGLEGYIVTGFDQFGEAVAPLGDVNGDGVGDFAVTSGGFFTVDPDGSIVDGVIHVLFGGVYLQALDASDGADGVVDAKLTFRDEDIAPFQANRAPFDRILTYDITETSRDFGVSLDLGFDPDDDPVRIVAEPAVRGYDVILGEFGRSFAVSIPDELAFNTLSFDLQIEDPSGAQGTITVNIQGDALPTEEAIIDLPDLTTAHNTAAVWLLPEVDRDGDPIELIDFKLRPFADGTLPEFAEARSVETAEGTNLVITRPNYVGELFAEVSFRDSKGAEGLEIVKVTTTNEAPTFEGNQIFRARPDEEIVINLADTPFFSDADGDILRFASAEQFFDAGIEISGVFNEILTITPDFITDPTQYGARKTSIPVQIEITDLVETVSGTIFANFENSAPQRVSNAETEFTVSSDRGIFIAPLARFEDPDGDDISLVSIVSDTGNFVQISNGQIGFEPLAPFTGVSVAQYDITVTDNFGAETTETIEVTFTNSAPRLKPDAILNRQVRPDGVTLDINDIFEDPDGSFGLNIVDIQTDDIGTARLLPDPDKIQFGFTPSFGVDPINGRETFEYALTVSDETGTETTENLLFVVDNAAPEVTGTAGPVLAGYPLADIPTLDIDNFIVAGVVTDPDGDDLIISTLGLPSDDRVNVSLEVGDDFLFDREIVVRWDPDASLSGTVDVTFDVRIVDAIGDSVIGSEAVVPVTYRFVNEAPRPVSDFPAVEMYIGDLQPLIYADFFEDPEGGPLVVQTTVADPDTNVTLLADVSGEFGELFLNEARLANGDYAQGANVSYNISLWDELGMRGTYGWNLSLTNEAPVARDTSAPVLDIKVTRLGELSASRVALDPDGLDATQELAFKEITSIDNSAFSFFEIPDFGPQNGDLLLRAGIESVESSLITATVVDAFGAEAEVTFAVSVSGNEAPTELPDIGLSLRPDESATVIAEDLATDADFANPDADEVITIDRIVRFSDGIERITTDGLGNFTIEVGDTPGEETATFIVRDRLGAETEIVLPVTVQDTREIVAEAAAEILALAEGDTVRGTPENLDGDLIKGFDETTTLTYEDTSFERGALTVTQGSAILDVDLDDDGASDVTTTLAGDFTSGDFLALQDGADVDVTFGRFLPDLADQRSQSEEAVNGLVNRDFLLGDGATDFEVTLLDIGFAGYKNVLGVYEIRPEGGIEDVQLIFDNAKQALKTSKSQPEAGVARIDEVEDGNELGFFLVQNAATWARKLDDVDEFSFVTLDGNAGNAFAGEALYLAVNGDLAHVNTFHALDAALNFDGAKHALSGVEPGGESISIGFEDLTGTGDRDFEDLVFNVARLDADFFAP